MTGAWGLCRFYDKAKTTRPFEPSLRTISRLKRLDNLTYLRFVEPKLSRISRLRRASLLSVGSKNEQQLSGISG